MAEVVKPGTAKPGKTATKAKNGPPAHLVSFLAQACSTLPDYVLVFAKVGCCVSVGNYFFSTFVCVRREKGHRRRSRRSPVLGWGFGGDRRDDEAFWAGLRWCMSCAPCTLAQLRSVFCPLSR